MPYTLTTDELKRVRRARSNREGSPLYPEFHGIIAAGATTYREIDTAIPDARKYAPLDTIIVTNNSDANLKLYINGRLVSLVAARSIVHIDNQAVWSYAVENISGADTVANEVQVTLQRAALTADKIAQLYGR